MNPPCLVHDKLTLADYVITRSTDCKITNQRGCDWFVIVKFLVKVSSSRLVDPFQSVVNLFCLSLFYCCCFHLQLYGIWFFSLALLISWRVDALRNEFVGPPPSSVVHMRWETHDSHIVVADAAVVRMNPARRFSILVVFLLGCGQSYMVFMVMFLFVIHVIFGLDTCLHITVLLCYNISRVMVIEKKIKSSLTLSPVRSPLVPGLCFQRRPPNYTYIFCCHRVSVQKLMIRKLMIRKATFLFYRGKVMIGVGLGLDY
ncbi:hypothetical protein IFM89_021530 [Coptis chinensis]|uniref:Uncharacterized protein n=1 Tax=Coptis chinensis TaxID=261450 RepID=A0A835M6G6_9MAGN|nr:hypothetical protein IFM89_021530 [Coptis chinensis]